MPASQPQSTPRTTLEPVCEALAAVIRRRREQAGLSLNQLAARTRLSRQMLSFVESARRIPTIDTAARISRALDVNLSRLVVEAEGMLQL